MPPITEEAQRADNEGVAANNHSIVASSYVVQEDLREVVNTGGLNAEIACVVVRRQQFRDPIDEIAAGPGSAQS